MSENVYLILFLSVSILFIIAILGLAFLAYQYFSIRSRIITLAQREFEEWRQREIDAIKKESLSLARREMQLELEQWKRTIEQHTRQDAIQKSQAVTTGKVTEHFIPYLPEFTYNPRDARFMGSPVDFIIFDGLTTGEVKKVVLMEIKTGSAGLNTRERQIREAILRGDVEWEELRPSFNPQE